jgi:hypothetical protein
MWTTPRLHGRKKFPSQNKKARRFACHRAFCGFGVAVVVRGERPGKSGVPTGLNNDLAGGMGE